MKKVFLMCILAVTADAQTTGITVKCCKGPNMTYSDRSSDCGVFKGASCDGQVYQGQPYSYQASSSRY